jgi:hypothetical protein
MAAAVCILGDAECADDVVRSLRVKWDLAEARAKWR